MDKKLLDRDLKEIEKFSKHKLIGELRSQDKDELMRFMIKQNLDLNKKVKILVNIAIFITILIILDIIGRIFLLFF